MGGKRSIIMEYRRESFNFFDEMLSNQNEKVVKTCIQHLEIVSHLK